ncbi:hypothetical protein J6590_051407 [Homalodisca vitripennis]|nr:hypothetical protein J6590_051407 [Homalodisca vitripennis]
MRATATGPQMLYQTWVQTPGLESEASCRLSRADRYGNVPLPVYCSAQVTNSAIAWIPTAAPPCLCYAGAGLPVAIVPESVNCCVTRADRISLTCKLLPHSTFRPPSAPLLLFPKCKSETPVCLANEMLYAIKIIGKRSTHIVISRH